MAAKLSCPVCGLTFKTEGKLNTHVEHHFSESQPPAAEEAPHVLCEEPGCGQLIALDQLDAHEQAHRLEKQAAQGAGAGVDRVLCPQGCGQWVPVGDLQVHEDKHLALSRVKTGAAAPATIPPASTSQGNQDLLAQLQDGLNHIAQPGQPGADDEALALHYQLAAWGGSDDDMEDGQVAGASGAGGSGQGAGLPGQEDLDAFLARQLQEQQDFNALQVKYGHSTNRPGTCYVCKQEGHWARDCPRNPSAVRNQAKLPTADLQLMVQQQRQEAQWQAGPPDIIPLLAANLARLPHASGCHAWLCGPVAHICGQAEDRGWGCGWRNIQMQVSHLRMRPGSVFASGLFGKPNIIPDIVSLQAWLEVAWAAGFDLVGAESLGWSIQGDSKWVGTTECATLLRFQGVTLDITDFSCTGSAGTVHQGVQCDGCGCIPITGLRYRSMSRPNYDLCEKCARQPGRVDRDGPFEEIGLPPISNTLPGVLDRAHVSISQQGSHDSAAGSDGQEGQGAQHAQQDKPVNWFDKYPNNKKRNQGPAGGHLPETPMQAALGAWVWSYFTGQYQAAAHLHSGAHDASQPVTLTGMPPLYFQHSGHSRTIIGMVRRPRARVAPGPKPAAGQDDRVPFDLQRWEYSLLILDPGTPSHNVYSALRDGRSGWQRFVSRGLHTLKSSEYQLLHCFNQAMDEAAKARSKVVVAADVIRVRA